MIRRKQHAPEVVYVDRGGDSSAKWLFWGACLGAGLALLYAPRTGEQTRRVLQRRLWKLRAMSEEKIDDLVQRIGTKAEDLAGGLADDQYAGDDDFEETEEFDETAEGNGFAAPSARQELEERLEQARARRRTPRPLPRDEEPLA
ncbi:MAG: YtxH domain-containing protein [Gemmatimonadota bacterium]